MQDCILNLVNFSYLHPDAGLIHGRVEYINSKGEMIRIVKSKNKLVYPTFKEEFQRNHIHSPTIFVLKKVFDKIGGFDENYAIEDMYLFLKLLDKGLSIFYTDDLLVKYRIHSNNTSAGNEMMLINHLSILDIFKQKKGFFINYLIFCRFTLLHKITNGTFLKSLKILVNYNIYSLLVFFDFLFYYNSIRIILKNYLIRFSSNY
jgi:GT2 family glycosyltransferase